MSYFWKNELVELRMISMDNFEEFVDLFYDTETRRCVEHGIPLPATDNYITDLLEYASSASQSGEAYWFGIYNSDAEMVGYALVDWINERARNAQMNITIFAEYRRRHYGSAAAGILKKYLFHERHMHKIGCNVMEGNLPGEAFAAALGFSLDGFRSEIFFTKGHYLGESYYSQLLEEYEGAAIKERYKTKEYFAHTIPTSDLGMISPATSEAGTNAITYAPLYGPRPYFWEYEGILLRDMQDEDWLQLHSMVYDTESCVRYDNDVKLPLFSDQLTEFEENHLDFLQEDGRLAFAIIDTKEQFLGCLQLCGLDSDNGKFSYSIYLLPDAREKKYASKALRLAFCYAFGELRMHKMIACINMDNPASAASLRSIGCLTEGILRDEAYYHGAYMDVLLFGLTAEQFFAANK